MFTYTTDQKKRLGTIETPLHLSYFIHRITKHLAPKVVLDPCCGRGNLLKPWIKRGRQVIGIDTNWKRINEGLKDKYFQWGELNFVEPNEHDFLGEDILKEFKPELVLCNPPWNRHPTRKSYPELFLRQIINLYGNKVPIVFLCPMGFRLNQRVISKRWRWMSKTLEISSIISVPIDCYKDTQFHSEVILFNIPRVKPHYFLDYLPEKS